MPNKVVSTFNLNLTGEVGPFSVGTVEQPVYQDLTSSVPWDILPGSMIRAGLSGKVQIGGQPVTLRVRVGAGTTLDNTNTVFGGYPAYEITLPASSTTEIGDIAADAVARPTGNAAFTKFQITAQAVSGTSSYDLQGVVASILPADGFGQGLYLQGNSNDVVSSDSTEHLIYEWAVDFAQFENVDQLLFGLAGQLDAGAGGTFRVRVGGTVGAGFGSPSPDGLEVLRWDNDGGVRPQIGARLTGGAVLAFPYASVPPGAQSVKLTAQSYGGGTHFAVAIQEAH